jgi:glyoxylase-like metal-dependent hydrolase (beta-lactamase superfamily II)
MNEIVINAFFHENTNTISYLVVDGETSYCAIIDPVLDYDCASGRTSTVSADKIVNHIVKNGYNVDWILETHAHADHLSSAYYLQGILGGSIGIGEHICRVQKTFKSLFNLENEFKTDGSQFDHLFTHEQIIKLGHVDITVLHTPGHTPACVSYLIEDNVFVGDTLFMPDYGTSRTDFPPLAVQRYSIIRFKEYCHSPAQQKCLLGMTIKPQIGMCLHGKHQCLNSNVTTCMFKLVCQ